MKGPPGMGLGRGTAPEEGASESACAPDFRLPKDRRLTRNSDIREAFNQGQRWVGRYMVLWLRSGSDARMRLGVVSSRKVGGAVARNQARRRLREAWRLNRYRFTGAFDVVLVSRGRVVNARARDVEEELIMLARRAGLIRDES